MEFLAYIGAAVMVVVAIWAYRYWKSTPTYARRVRESHARQVQESRSAPPETNPDFPDAALLDEIEEQLAEMPTGIELMNLPTEERRLMADRRHELQSERARLLAQRKRGTHRRNQRRRNSRPSE